MSYLQPPADHGTNGATAATGVPVEPPTFDLTIRFSASLPDLLISIPASENATTSTLKQRIRASLPKDLADRRIRLIHAGKALDDSTPLSSSLKRPVSRPPSRITTPGPYEDSGDVTSSSTTKGKSPIRDPPVLQPRIYIHCSIGDVVLSKEELAVEAALARPSQSGDSGKVQQGGSQTNLDNDATGNNNNTPAPRGFDRLLNAGFTATEVQSLRLQFMAIQAHTHTPDTMPSPNTLRNMEDRWLDNSNSAGTDGEGGGLDGMGAGGGAGSTDEENQAGALDDMIWGTVLGFFWPIGCVMWGTREESIFSPRRKIAIVIGVVLNMGLGLVRYGG